MKACLFQRGWGKKSASVCKLRNSVVTKVAWACDCFMKYNYIWRTEALSVLNIMSMVLTYSRKNSCCQPSCHCPASSSSMVWAAWFGNWIQGLLWLAGCTLSVQTGFFGREREREECFLLGEWPEKSPQRRHTHMNTQAIAKRARVKRLKWVYYQCGKRPCFCSQIQLSLEIHLLWFVDRSVFTITIKIYII